VTRDEAMERIDALASHVWMVRAFLKHSDEATEEESLQEVHRELYDFMLALGPAYTEKNATAYLKMAAKKLARLRRAADQFAQIQPQISTHTNFQMAARSLTTAVAAIGRALEEVRHLD